MSAARFSLLLFLAGAATAAAAAAGSGTSTPAPLLSQAGQAVAALWGIEGGGQDGSMSSSSSRKLLDTQGTDATCTCGGRTYRRSGSCWCTCGRKLAGMESPQEVQQDAAVMEPAAVTPSTSRALLAAAAADATTTAAAADSCECVGRSTTYRYPGSGCSCWVACSG